MRVNDLGLVTVAEAADMLGVSRATVRKWVGRYAIPTKIVEGRLYLAERPLLECDRDRRHTLATRGGRRRTAA